MTSVYLHESNIVSPLGFGTSQNFASLLAGKSGLKAMVLERVGKLYAGQIEDALLQKHFTAIDSSKGFTRIEKLAILALSPILQQRTLNKNSLLIVATTKGNIYALEHQSIECAFIPAMAKKIARYFGFQMDPVIVSNACTSGLLALSVAKRYIQMNMAQDVYVLAVDELTTFVASGFQSFQALSDEICRPYDSDRKGINLGEAAVAVYVSKEPEAGCVGIAGDANINDANHISGPSRTGEGLYLSIENALREANIDQSQIDYIVGHGTATLYNDEMEAIALNRSGLQNTPTISLKGYYGHTLATSGLLETVITAECLRRNICLPSKGFKHLGTTQSLNILTETRKQSMKIALKTSSGFGGCNSALILVKTK